MRGRGRLGVVGHGAGGGGGGGEADAGQGAVEECLWEEVGEMVVGAQEASLHPLVRRATACLPAAYAVPQ